MSMIERGGYRAAALVLLNVHLFLCAGCGRDEDDGGAATASKPSAPIVVPFKYPDFSVRGRLADPMNVTYGFDAGPLPVDPATLSDATARAAAIWNATGVCRLAPVDAGKKPDVTIGFRRGAHAECRPFVGWDGEVAHTGPMEKSPIEIHLDGALEWSANGERGKHLMAVILHELGHALGLEHSLDPAALMFAKYDPKKIALEASDLAGIHSLYGKGQDGDGDLLVGLMHRGAGMTDRETMDVPDVTSTLRRVAPLGVTDFGLFDVNGDARDEVVVWRTDTAGVGAVKYYFLDETGRLRKTVGPILGQFHGGRRPFYTLGPGNRAVMLTVLPNGKFNAFQCDQNGLPEAEFPIDSYPWDENADGVLDQPASQPMKKPNEAREMRCGEINGDGIDDCVMRWTARH